MTSLDKTVDDIGRIAAEFPRLYREAARQYGVEVESLVGSGSSDVNRIERTLDGLLDFAADPDCLELFRRLCRHYWGIDPAAKQEFQCCSYLAPPWCLAGER